MASKCTYLRRKWERIVVEQREMIISAKICLDFKKRNNALKIDFSLDFLSEVVVSD